MNLFITPMTALQYSSVLLEISVLGSDAWPIDIFKWKEACEGLTLSKN